MARRKKNKKSGYFWYAIAGVILFLVIAGVTKNIDKSIIEFQTVTRDEFTLNFNPIPELKLFESALIKCKLENQIDLYDNKNNYITTVRYGDDETFRPVIGTQEILIRTDTVFGKGVVKVIMWCDKSRLSSDGFVPVLRGGTLTTEIKTVKSSQVPSTVVKSNSVNFGGNEIVLDGKTVELHQYEMTNSQLKGKLDDSRHYAVTLSITTKGNLEFTQLTKATCDRLNVPKECQNVYRHNVDSGKVTTFFGLIIENIKDPSIFAQRTQKIDFLTPFDNNIFNIINDNTLRYKISVADYEKSEGVVGSTVTWRGETGEDNVVIKRITHGVLTQKEGKFSFAITNVDVPRNLVENTKSDRGTVCIKIENESNRPNTEKCFIASVEVPQQDDEDGSDGDDGSSIGNIPQFTVQDVFRLLESLGSLALIGVVAIIVIAIVIAVLKKVLRGGRETYRFGGGGGLLPKGYGGSRSPF